MRVKQNVFLLQVNMIHHFTYFTVEDWRNVWKMKLNEPGRQKLGR